MNQLCYASAFICFVITTALALPANSEFFGCSEITIENIKNLPEEHPHQIELTSNPEQGTGIIKVPGLAEFTTKFVHEGLDSRFWGWSTHQRYAFQIRSLKHTDPDFLLQHQNRKIAFLGWYYDFGSVDKPSVGDGADRLYACHKH